MSSDPAATATDPPEDDMSTYEGMMRARVQKVKEYLVNNYPEGQNRETWKKVASVLFDERLLPWDSEENPVDYLEMVSNSLSRGYWHENILTPKTGPMGYILNLKHNYAAAANREAETLYRTPGTLL
eukprot:TRINITY_DN1308_c0_g1_i1.p1 TRINITY_DN1308_c0_g1~~TRINITY_DN1308_c0_g1_i1.p1  ORF type:complete len:127 (+),score=21.74 TRINITY_DN1308_c0_g1_i1:89-469(+)